MERQKRERWRERRRGGRKTANHLEASLTLQLALAIIDTKQ